MKLKYKIKEVKNGWAIFIKKHWYNSWERLDNTYWSNINSLIDYLNSKSIKYEM